MNYENVCIPSQLLAQTQESTLNALKNNLILYIKKYLKKPYDVEICISEDQKIHLYIMDRPRYKNCEDDIKNDLSKQMYEIFSNAKVEMHLDYSVCFPDFQPQKYIAGEAVDNSGITKKSVDSEEEKNEFDYERLSENYQATMPHYSFEQVILPEQTREEIEEAIGVLQVEAKVFDEWGLRSIIPTATSALSFYGPPGTGKSMAAEAVAQKMGKKILSATYADIESKYHGEGPKMVKAIFRAAEKQDAVLFLDESDSLLSKRLTNVSDGSAQAINSMRSQLLICLEKFKGVVIFATNLVVNYDRAFLSRLINIEFPMPNQKAREEIWNRHIRGDGIHIPLASNVDTYELAQKYEFCGRDIKNAVKSACVSAALQSSDTVTQEIFLKACEKTKIESEKAVAADDHTNMKKADVSEQTKKSLTQAIQKKINSEAKSCDDI